MKPKKSRAFVDWVNAEGIESITQVLKVSPRTVAYWLTGHCHPKVDHIKAIQKISGLTYAQIIDRAVLTKRKYLS